MRLHCVCVPALGSQKQTDLATAKAIKGTCQDMCPEKERYMREDRRRLSYYEIIPGTDQQVRTLMHDCCRLCHATGTLAVSPRDLHSSVSCSTDWPR